MLANYTSTYWRIDIHLSIHREGFDLILYLIPSIGIFPFQANCLYSNNRWLGACSGQFMILCRSLLWLGFAPSILTEQVRPSRDSHQFSATAR
jgi:hypothetical protein